jgi:hypothetical protein
MKQLVFIGLDDTDILGGPFGTGRVARDLAEYLESLGMGHTIGVIRHQLLVDPRIHYTSHNSSKCIEFEAEVSLSNLHKAGMRYIKEHFQKGSDPGLCTCAADQATEELVKYGQLAQKELISKEQAFILSNRLGILLTELGGTGEGIIGALASVGLRAGGNDGRYVQLRGIKDIKGQVSVGEILKTTAIVGIVDEEGNPVANTEIIDSHDWVKPNVINGKPVLRIRLNNSRTAGRIWETVEQKHKQKAEKERSI